MSLQLQQPAGLSHVSDAVGKNDGSADMQPTSIELVAPDERMTPASIAAGSGHQSRMLAGHKEESQPTSGLPVSEVEGTMLSQPSAGHSVAALEPQAGQQATESPVDSSGSEYVRPRTVKSKEQYEEDPQPGTVEANVVGESERSEAAVAAVQGPAWQSSQPPAPQSDESPARQSDEPPARQFGQPAAWQSGQPAAWKSGQSPAATAPVPDKRISKNGSRDEVSSLAEELRTAAEQQGRHSLKQLAAADSIKLRRRQQGSAGQSGCAGGAQAVAWSDEQSGAESGAATADDGPAAVGDAVSMGDAAAAKPASDAALRNSAASRRDATRIARAGVAVGRDDSLDEEDNLATGEPGFKLHLSGQVRALMQPKPLTDIASSYTAALICAQSNQLMPTTKDA